LRIKSNIRIYKWRV